jgi:hypothetical protein
VLTKTDVEVLQQDFFWSKLKAAFFKGKRKFLSAATVIKKISKPLPLLENARVSTCLVFQACLIFLGKSWGQCYKTNTVVIYCHFKFELPWYFYTIECNLEWQ